MKCPVSGDPMIVVERNRIEIDYSPTSKGIWFDSGELELIAEALNIEVDLPNYLEFPVISSDEQVLKSPRTGKPMEKINLGSDAEPIIIDRDKDGLGLWFDAGELAKVLERYLQKQPETGNEQVLSFLSETIHY